MPRIFSSERPAQRRALTSALGTSAKSGKLAALQRMADDSPVQRQLADLQGKAMQRMEEEEVMQGKDAGGVMQQSNVRSTGGGTDLPDPL